MTDDDGVRRVPCGGDGADDCNPAGPCERLAAVGADVALPPAVVDLAQCCQHAGPGVAVGR